jgi:anti-sigma factor RsiW
MNRESNVAVPALDAEFAQRVLRRAKHERRRNATLRAVLGLSASLAVAFLVVRPGSGRNPVATSALAAGDLAEGEVSDLDPQDEDPGAFFFPDSQPAAAEAQITDAQLLVEDDVPEAASGGEVSDE